MLEVGAGDRRRAFRAQGQRAAALVLERVHLLLDDVGARAGGALEERGVLEGGRLDRAVAIERAEALGLSDDELPERLLGRKDVVGAARRLEDRHEARSGARKGLRASSVPSVVGGPWPEYTTVSGGKRSVRARRVSTSVSQSAPGRSVRPTEPEKRTSPEKRHPPEWYARWPGEWPGTRIVSKVIAASSSVSSPFSKTSAVWGRAGTPPGTRSGRFSRRA